MTGVDVLRPGVLAGLRIAVAGKGPAAATLVAERLRALGADVASLRAELGDEEAVTAEMAAAGRFDALVVDGAGLFAAAGGGMAGLRAAVDDGWNAVRAVASSSWIADGAADGGKVVLVAPGPGTGAHAEATAAALENTARTLSIEWARFGIRTTAIRPGDGAQPEEIAELVAFLVSPAGDYHSGCALRPGELR